MIMVVTAGWISREETEIKKRIKDLPSTNNNWYHNTKIITYPRPDFHSAWTVAVCLCAGCSPDVGTAAGGNLCVDCRAVDYLCDYSSYAGSHVHNHDCNL